MSKKNTDVLKKIIAFNSEKRVIQPNDVMCREIKVDGTYRLASVPYANIDQIMREITPVLSKMGLGVVLSQEFADDDHNPKFRVARGILTVYSDTGASKDFFGPWIRAVNDGSGFDENQTLWGIARLWQRILLLNVFTALETEGEPKILENAKTPAADKPGTHQQTSPNENTVSQITQLIDRVRKARKWVEFSRTVRETLGVHDLMQMPPEKIAEAEKIAEKIMASQ